MEKSRQEIIKQCGELVDLVGDLYDENEKNWRRYCNESRKLKKVEQELAEANFRIQKAISQINQLQIMGMKPLQVFKDDLLKILECNKDDLLKMLEGNYE